MPGWIGKETDWCDARRLETALGRVRGGGAGHDPVSLDDNADEILVIPGIDDEPQQIGLVEQLANTVFAGPVAGDAAIPDFRAIVAADIAHDLLSATHSDTVASVVTRGDLVVGTAAGWNDLAIGGAGTYLRSDGADPSWQAITVADITDLAYAVPNLTLGLANAVGAANTVIRTDATILAFDAVDPVTLAVATVAAPGVATVTARRDHAHAITSSSNPGAAAAILATAADGGLQLLRLGIGTDPDTDNAIKVVDNTWIGAGAAAGRIIVDTTPNPDQIQLAAADLYLPASHGIIHADSVVANKVLLADGTRYIPGDVTVSIITDLAYAAPALTLGVANAIGAANTVIRTDATILVFDAVNPVTLVPDAAAVVGVATVTARRDHGHAIACAAPNVNLSVLSTNAEGGGTSFARSTHSHAITTSSNPVAGRSILASAADGGLQLLRLGIGADPDTNNRITMVDEGTIGEDNVLLTFDTDDGKLTLTGDQVISSGLWVGRDASAAIGTIGYTANLISYQNAAEYPVYAFHKLTIALTSESFDGDSFGTTAKTLIDLSDAPGAGGFAAPAGVYAVSCEVSIRDAGSAGGDFYIILGPTNNAGEGKVLRCSGLPNDTWTSGDLLVPCDVNGDIYYQIVASGAGLLEVYIRIWGYFI